MSLCTQHRNGESETLGEGVGQAALIHVCIVCVAPVEGIAFQHCVCLTFILEHRKKWRFGAGAAVGRV